MKTKSFSFESFYVRTFFFLINEDSFLTTGTKQQRKTQIFYACQGTQKSINSRKYYEVLSYICQIYLKKNKNLSIKNNHYDYELVF